MKPASLAWETQALITMAFQSTQITSFYSKEASVSEKCWWLKPCFAGASPLN